MTKFSNIKVLVTDPDMHTKAHTNLADVIERLMKIARKSPDFNPGMDRA